MPASLIQATFAAALTSVVICCFSGCAMTQYSGDCTTQKSVAAGELKGDGDYHLIAANNGQFTLFPGQAVTVPVAVDPVHGATGVVTISAAGLPSGVTMAPVTAQIGSTANLTFTSTPALGAECFTGATQIYTANSTVALTSTGSTGGKTLGVDLQMVLENPAYAPAKTTLPVVAINTAGSAAVLSKDDYLAGTMTIVDPTTKSNNYTGTLQIKGHGNTTWIMPKKPYRIKLDSKSKLLGMPSEKNWILLANYDDKTMLRDAVASQIAGITGLPWASKSHFVELNLNGQYEGTYQLIENVDINSNRVNIADSDTSTDPTQNGFLMEIDQRQDETLNWVTPHGIYVGSDDPDPPTEADAAYIQPRVDTAEGSFYSPISAAPGQGWRKYWDENSLVDWFITNELMGNEDADAYSSDYFYKDAGDVPFVMGPVWDFDVSSGNDNYHPIQDPTVPWVRTQHPWYVALFRDPAFVALVKARWQAIRPQIDTLPAYIDGQAATLAQPSTNNYARWPTLYQRVWPNPAAQGSYQGEVDTFKAWMSKRVAYMDSQYLN